MSDAESPPPSKSASDQADPGRPGGPPPAASATGSWMKLIGLGMELAGSTLGLAAVGYLVDWYRAGPDRYGTAIGALVGFALGMFRFIQRAMVETRNQSR